MKKQISDIALVFKKVLGNKMIGLLHIGSTEKEDETAFSDIDLILLSEKLEIENLRALREIVRNLDYLVDIPIIQRNEIPVNPDLFQMGTHGCYFIGVLKRARIVHGLNLFETYPEPSKGAMKISIFRKIAEYTWTSRRMYIESNRERSVYHNYQFSSRLLKAIKDILWLYDPQISHSLTTTESVDQLKININKLLTVKEWEVLRSISNPSLRNSFAANMSEDFLQIRVSILEKLYSCAVFLLNDS